MFVAPFPLDREARSFYLCARVFLMPRPRPLLIALLVAAACSSASPALVPSAPPVVREGAIAPATPQSYRETLAALQGRPLVVNFWASWCGPCATEMPRLVEAAGRYGDRVGFLGVDVEDVTEEAEAFAKRLGVPFRSVADPRGEIKRAEKVLGLPTTLFYRADGKLAFSHAGEISGEQLESKLRELVRIDETG